MTLVHEKLEDFIPVCRRRKKIVGIGVCVGYGTFHTQFRVESSGRHLGTFGIYAVRYDCVGRSDIVGRAKEDVVPSCLSEQQFIEL